MASKGPALALRYSESAIRQNTIQPKHGAKTAPLMTDRKQKGGGREEPRKANPQWPTSSNKASYLMFGPPPQTALWSSTRELVGTFCTQTMKWVSEVGRGMTERVLRVKESGVSKTTSHLLWGCSDTLGLVLQALAP